MLFQTGNTKENVAPLPLLRHMIERLIRSPIPIPPDVVL
jgi:hypothetical protein